jgi:peptidoglycan/LPS O-acetylase OafA/YrhL
MNQHRNNFDLLRLIFASCVLVSHAYELSRHPSLHGLSLFFSAEAGVKAFFVASGYLVVMSFENSASLREYAGKRARRIYPAYFTVVVLAALAGLAISDEPAGTLLAGVGRYLAANLAFLNFLAPTIPGIFVGNTWQEVNGALWTLKVEVMFYAAVPFIVWTYRRLGVIPTLTALYALSVLYTGVLGVLAQGSERGVWAQLQRQLPGQLTYFIAGTALYVYREALPRRWPLLLGVAAGLYVAQRLLHAPLAAAMLEPVWLAIVVVYAAYGLRFLGNFARYGDLSYGIYIFHLPIIQAAVAAGLFAFQPWLAFALCATATVLAALLSWHLVEKPFLTRRSHYRLAEKTA